MARRDTHAQPPRTKTAPGPEPLVARPRGTPTLTHVVTAAEANATLAAVLKALQGTSWERAREAIRRGKVALGESLVTDPTARVTVGATVSLYDAAPRVDREVTDLDASRVVFLDDHLVVVDKPAGVSTVPYDEGERGTLVDRVQHFLHRHRGADRNAPLFIVHRIDKDTSGLVVFGRSWAAKRHLAGLFRAHAIERRYLALVCGHPSRDRFTMDTVFIEDRGDGLRGSARNPHPGSGKRAITHVEVLSRLAGPLSLVRCQLETGRTHQIRIHLAESGHPLVGERVYGKAIPRPIDHPRALLHAHELGFTHPAHEDRMLRFRRDPPEDFLTVLAECGGALPREDA